MASSSTGPVARRGQSPGAPAKPTGKGGKEIPLQDLLDQIHALEKYKQDEEKGKKKEEAQRKKELATAKKTLLKDIATVRGTVKKRQQEAQKLRATLKKLEQVNMETAQKKTQAGIKIDEMIMKTEQRHNQTEVELQEKIGQMGEANGLLTYLERAASMLDKGVVVPRDPRAELEAASRGRLAALGNGGDGALGYDDSADNLEVVSLARELHELRMRYDELEEEHHSLLQTQNGGASQEFTHLWNEIRKLRGENQDLHERLQDTELRVQQVPQNMPRPLSAGMTATSISPTSFSLVPPTLGQPSAVPMTRYLSYPGQGPGHPAYLPPQAIPLVTGLRAVAGTLQVPVPAASPQPIQMPGTPRGRSPVSVTVSPVPSGPGVPVGSSPGTAVVRTVSRADAGQRPVQLYPLPVQVQGHVEGHPLYPVMNVGDHLEIKFPQGSVPATISPLPTMNGISTSPQRLNLSPTLPPRVDTAPQAIPTLVRPGTVPQAAQNWGAPPPATNFITEPIAGRVPQFSGGRIPSSPYPGLAPPSGGQAPNGFQVVEPVTAATAHAVAAAAAAGLNVPFGRAKPPEVDRSMRSEG